MTEQQRELILVCRQAAVFCQLAGDRGQPMIEGLLEAAAELERLYADNARDRAINRLLDEIGEEIYGSNELFQAGEEAQAALNLSEDGARSPSREHS